MNTSSCQVLIEQLNVFWIDWYDSLFLDEDKTASDKAGERTWYFNRSGRLIQLLVLFSTSLYFKRAKPKPWNILAAFLDGKRATIRSCIFYGSQMERIRAQNVIAKPGVKYFLAASIKKCFTQQEFCSNNIFLLGLSRQYTEFIWNYGGGW